MKKRAFILSRDSINTLIQTLKKLKCLAWSTGLPSFCDGNDDHLPQSYVFSQTRGGLLCCWCLQWEQHQDSSSCKAAEEMLHEQKTCHLSVTASVIPRVHLDLYISNSGSVQDVPVLCSTSMYQQVLYPPAGCF